MDTRRELGQKIRALVKSKGWTAEEFGTKIGRSRQTVQDIFAGKVSVSLELLKIISDALEVEIYYFFKSVNSLPNSKEELTELIKNIYREILKRNYVQVATLKTLIINIVTSAFNGNGLVFLELTYDKEKEEYVFNEHYKELLIKLTEEEQSKFSKSLISHLFTEIKDQLDTSSMERLIFEYINKKY